jgi:tetratricopeptide (TPR) repeat protein
VETERWQKVEQLYHSALEQAVNARAAFIEQACAGDDSLRREVESLLSQTEGEESFMEEPAMDVAAKDLASSFRPGGRSWPASIGRYRIIRLLGEGGMGTVYEAEQEEPRRIVALKVIKLGLATPERLRRFRRESQALARLQHPGIAQIYESNTADTGFGPQPYFAMEFIRGLPLKQYAEIHQLSTRQKLVLMAKVCDAVHHAHQRGLIHRDLKPGNILVDETGQPKILDFGVARIIQADAKEGREQLSLQTDLGQLVGTLEYMSPEQVLGDPLEVDIRSDVYALGVMLYEILSGRLPYEVNLRQLPEAVHAIREEEPASLSSINRQYRGDIETLLKKALEKDKARRYASAADLGADLQRHLNDQPIAARPPSAGYQLRKFAKRHRALMAGVAAVFLVLLAGIAVSTSQAIRAGRERQTALRERDRATAAERTARQAQDEAIDDRNRAVSAEASALQERNRAVMEKQRADDETATAKAVSDFLQNDLLSQASARVQSGPKTKPDPDIKVRSVLDRAAGRIQGKFDGQPIVEASIRHTIGQAYFDLGVYPEAQRQWELAVRLRRQALGPDHPDTLTSMNDLADAYRMQSVFAQAEPLLSKVVEARRRVLGDDNPDSLNSMHELAVLYLDEEKYAQAELLLARTLEVQRRVLGPDHADTLAGLHDLATAYETEGKFGQAEPLETRALEARRRVLGEEHPQTIRSMNELGTIYRREGKYAQAESIMKEAVEVQHRVLGEEHSDTLTSMNNLAVVYSNERNDEKAEALYGRVLEIRRRVLGNQHANTLNSMNNLAVLYRNEGKFAQAEKLLSEAVDIERRVFGEERPATLHILDNLGSVYRSEGKYEQAEAALTRAVNAQRRILGESHPDTLRTMHDSGLLYRAEGKYAQAEQLLTQVLETRRRSLGPEHPDTLRSMSDLGTVYHDEGKNEMAGPLLMKALDIQRRVLGPHPDTWDTLGSLAELQLQEQKYVDAEPLLRDAVGTTEKTTPDTWNRYYFQTLLGASLAGQQRFAEAEPLLVSGREGIVQRAAAIPADRLSLVAQAGQRIVQLYESWGKLEKTAEWRQRLQAN